LLARLPKVVADQVVTVSDYVRQWQIDVALTPPGRVKTVWNGLPVRAAPATAERRAHAILGLDARRPLILCACRATPGKGIACLLRAFAELAQEAAIKDLAPALLYIGDGPQLPELRALRETLSARDDIILTGYRQDVQVFLADADFSVVPSTCQDAFPLAVLESMAMGKPVIATRVGGIPEMIEDGVHGILVPPGDVPALCAAMRTLLADPDKARQYGEAARRRVADQFTLERQIRQLLEIVEPAFRLPCEIAKITS